MIYWQSKHWFSTPCPHISRPRPLLPWEKKGLRPAPRTSILRAVTKLSLQHESVASKWRKLQVWKCFCLGHCAFNMAFTLQKIVATQLKANILVAFNATRTKVWKQEGEVVSIQICSVSQPDCNLFGSSRGSNRYVADKYHCAIAFQ